jgi:hypothetical protein
MHAKASTEGSGVERETVNHISSESWSRERSKRTAQRHGHHIEFVLHSLNPLLAVDCPVSRNG